MNTGTGREIQLIDKDGVNKAKIDSSNNLWTINEAIILNNIAVALKSMLVAGSDGTYQRPLKTDSAGRLIVATEVVSVFPSFEQFIRRVVAANSVYNTTYTMTQDTAIKEFHVGGRTPCEAYMARYVAATQSIISGFNSNADVAAWTNTGIGSSAGIAWVYNTAQMIEGTGSASHTFTQSDQNNYPEITFTFGTPQDLSVWRYVEAYARVTVAAGGAQTRAVQVILTSGTAKRIWQVSGTTTTAPFSTEQWHLVTGEIETPHAVSGTGVFDISSVNSISLKLLDGGNKTGTVYWDVPRFYGAITIVDKIYTAGDTNQLKFDPVKVFNNGEVLLISIKNNSATAAEIQAAASGVSV